MTVTLLRNISLATAAALAALTLAGCASMSEPAQSVSLVEPVNGAPSTARSRCGLVSKAWRLSRLATSNPTAVTTTW